MLSESHVVGSIPAQAAEQPRLSSTVYNTYSGISFTLFSRVLSFM